MSNLRLLYLENWKHIRLSNTLTFYFSTTISISKTEGNKSLDVTMPKQKSPWPEWAKTDTTSDAYYEEDP